MPYTKGKEVEMKHTFIISTWYGADSYIQAAKMEINNGHNPEKYGHDFSRLPVKKKETALEYLRGWKKQAIEKGLQFLYSTYCREDAQYEIASTDKLVVARGWMKDL